MSAMLLGPDPPARNLSPEWLRRAKHLMEALFLRIDVALLADSWLLPLAVLSGRLLMTRPMFQYANMAISKGTM
ncbi:hypothetical protein RvY_06274 [Ramazzottius varieornatus]|uniref:Uncharacterized protein n=1 Tax=Ramazzottius varieornatus TaxID=947166 RepID=A0A1D1V6Q5_RAMVA|nr:hypothetical protein RvY_06274 [Ramazzottius varieornatus]